MLGYVSESKLKTLLVAIGDGERDSELARQRLSSIRDFALHAAFERVDRDASLSVSGREINNFLRDNGVVTVLDSECQALVNYFDSDANGKLGFSEFIQIFLPCEDNVLRDITINRPSIRVTRFDRLPADIELAMVAVIEREISLQRRLESLKRDLEIGLDYNAMSAFRSVDRYSQGSVNTSNLNAFLRGQGHFATETELFAIIRRIDQDGDALVGYSEWADFLRPISGVSTLPVTRTIVDPVTTTIVEEVLPAYRSYLDYPYPYPYSRYYPLPYSRYYPYYSRYYPYTRYPYEPLSPTKTVTRTYTPERPGRTVETTTYHSPLGSRTYTRYI